MEEQLGQQASVELLGKSASKIFMNFPKCHLIKLKHQKEEYIPDAVLNDLSSDQRLLFEYCKGIGLGKVNDLWTAWKIGALNHTCWLILAI